nr:U6 snRNA-associated Sm-like protein LSm6 [Saimiri boliviensis boliviensis]
MSLQKQTLSNFLKQIFRQPAVVKLNSRVDYRGSWLSQNGYINTALESTEEYVNGQLKNKYGRIGTYGDVFIQGKYIST